MGVWLFFILLLSIDRSIGLTLLVLLLALLPVFLSHRFRDSLDAASSAQQSYCKVMREFCGDITDEESLGIGAGVLIRYISAFNEISSFYDLLRSKVNLLMIDQLNDVLLGPMNAVRDGKKRVEKSAGEYDTCRRRFLSLQKTVDDNVVQQAEKELRHARSTYDADRFGLARSLLSIHHTKRSFFVETTSEMVDAHMTFFKQGFDLIRVMEPYIHETLAQVQDWRASADMDMDTFDDNIALYLERQSTSLNSTDDNESDSDVSGGGYHHHHKRNLSQGSMGSFTNHMNGSPKFSGPVQMSAFQSQMAQEIEASMRLHMQKGDVAILKQGYLLKRSSNIRGDWKSRFFVLDSKGSLYYYTKNLAFIKSSTSQQKSGGGHPGVPHQTVELLTSTVKMDADDDDIGLRFCFRIVSPMRTYTLQAESEADRAAWVGAIQCVIASLLNGIDSSSSQQETTRQQKEGGGGAGALSPTLSTHSIYTDTDQILQNEGSEITSLGSDDRYLSAKSFGTLSQASFEEDNPVLDELRSIPGNDCCADCGAPMPDWASLNLTVTLCIECSGTHRKLGVHISKVRSITLDDNAWGSTIVKIFKSAGNDFVNSILEKRLKDRMVKDDSWLWNADDDEPVLSPDLASPRRSVIQMTRKPNPNDPLRVKEDFIRAKYVGKSFMDSRDIEKVMGDSAPQEYFWRSLFSADYRSIITSLLYGADTNSPHTEKLAAVIFEKRERQAHGAATAVYGKAVPPKNLDETLSSKTREELGLSALHIMSELKEVNVLELLTLYSGDINTKDAFQRTPLHYCILNQWDEGAKVLLKRGAMAAKDSKDVYGITALEMAMGRGQLTDESLFTMLAQ